MSNDTKAFREAVMAMHFVKDASYQKAWKKRGEVLSILANIARKVDRLESALVVDSPFPGEALIDTAIDLFVYCIKYETFLADLDSSIAARLFAGAAPMQVFSDGTNGFDFLLSKIDLSKICDCSGDTTSSIENVIVRFSDLERSFIGLSPRDTVINRFSSVERLISASVTLIGALKREHAVSYTSFVGLREV